MGCEKVKNPAYNPEYYVKENKLKNYMINELGIPEQDIHKYIYNNSVHVRNLDLHRFSVLDFIKLKVDGTIKSLPSGLHERICKEDIPYVIHYVYIEVAKIPVDVCLTAGFSKVLKHYGLSTFIVNFRQLEGKFKMNDYICKAYGVSSGEIDNVHLSIYHDSFMNKNLDITIYESDKPVIKIIKKYIKFFRLEFPVKGKSSYHSYFDKGSILKGITQEQLDSIKSKFIPPVNKSTVIKQLGIVKFRRLGHEVIVSAINNNYNIEEYNLHMELLLSITNNIPGYIIYPLLEAKLIPEITKDYLDVTDSYARAFELVECKLDELSYTIEELKELTPRTLLKELDLPYRKIESITGVQIHDYIADYYNVPFWEIPGATPLGWFKYKSNMESVLRYYKLPADANSYNVLLKTLPRQFRRSVNLRIYQHLIV